MTAAPFEIREDDLSGEATRSLLRLHLEGMQANSPAGSVFALDLTGLMAPGVTVWGMVRLSLETGSGPAFEPALNLYRRRGFVEGGSFAQYEKSAFDQFLHLAL